MFVQFFKSYLVFRISMNGIFKVHLFLLVFVLPIKCAYLNAWHEMNDSLFFLLGEHFLVQVCYHSDEKSCERFL